MAKVEMPLEELRELENKIETLEKEKQVLLDNEQQVVIYHKYFNGKIKKIEKGHMSFDIIDHRAFRRESLTMDVSTLFDRGLIEIDFTEDSARTTKDYKNLSDVITDIRREEESKVKDNLYEVTQKMILARNETSHIAERYDLKILSIEENYVKKIIKFEKNRDEEIEKLLKKNEELQEEFDDFKEDKKRVSLEEQIEELQKSLKSAENSAKITNNRTFWQRVFDVKPIISIDTKLD